MKISNPQKPFDHPHHLKSQVPFGELSFNGSNFMYRLFINSLIFIKMTQSKIKLEKG